MVSATLWMKREAISMQVHPNVQKNGTLAGVMEMSPSGSPAWVLPPLICRKRTGRVQETDKRVHRCNDFFPHPEVGGIARPEYFPNPGLARQDGAGIFSLIARWNLHDTNSSLSS